MVLAVRVPLTLQYLQAVNMAEEFTIKSQAIEDKINQLLPSQGGFQAGVDFSASTMVIPIVDLTETAEGSALRQDLQTALSHGSATEFTVQNASTTIITTTGYFRVVGSASGTMGVNTANHNASIRISDGTTTKEVWNYHTLATTTRSMSSVTFDVVVFLSAGDSLIIHSDNAETIIGGSARQIADINGNLINP